MRLIDDGLFDRDEVNYTEVTDVYKGYLSEVGSAAAVESQRQVVTERAGGFQQTPSELARAVRAAHVARFGRTNFTEANKLSTLLVVGQAMHGQRSTDVRLKSSSAVNLMSSGSCKI